MELDIELDHLTDMMSTLELSIAGAYAAIQQGRDTSKLARTTLLEGSLLYHMVNVKKNRS